ncbi:MAG: helix-turn-helix transcriptional regulator [Hyphomicrobiaceae bacterium]
MPMSTDARSSAQEPRRGTSADEESYLHLVGERVRLQRARRGMSRRVLAHASGVSERYLAQLETGSGNASLLVLRQIASAMGIAVQDLVSDRPDPSVDVALLRHRIDRLSVDEVRELRALVTRRFGRASSPEQRVALIGLRGAGKTALGRRSAEAIGFPFIELDREIERTSGMSLAALFAAEGQTGFRRREAAALEAVVKAHDRAVIATGGSIATEPATFDLLLSTCHVIWLQAAPEEHMQRVADQGDWRPMQASQQAMEDLRAILASRTTLYSQAHAVFDTSGITEDAALAGLVRLINTKIADQAEADNDRANPG